MVAHVRTIQVYANYALCAGRHISYIAFLHVVMLNFLRGRILIFYLNEKISLTN